MSEKLEIIDLVARFLLINIFPFLLIFGLVKRRRRRLATAANHELTLLADEIRTVGILGYYVILSVYFFSIPALRYSRSAGVDVLLVEPDGYTVFIIALISFALVVASIYLRLGRRWAYWLLVILFSVLVCYAFFSILEYGFISVVPVTIFCYFLYQLSKPSFRI